MATLIMLCMISRFLSSLLFLKERCDMYEKEKQISHR